eukprot:TRINITY_DN4039_c0_g1_i3.p1 TRINITY_DN4039_c0_g1~~TRINITY_DN4039_c0_g1_i3.p1  ORF type:complete len:351 (-),score=49.27 TRINITY_DN4039_c0_g1_i3:189-1241(-)
MSPRRAFSDMTAWLEPRGIQDKRPEWPTSHGKVMFAPSPCYGRRLTDVTVLDGCSANHSSRFDGASLNTPDRMKRRRNTEAVLLARANEVSAHCASRKAPGIDEVCRSIALLKKDRQHDSGRHFRRNCKDADEVHAYKLGVTSANVVNSQQRVGIARQRRPSSAPLSRTRRVTEDALRLAKHLEDIAAEIRRTQNEKAQSLSDSEAASVRGKSRACTSDLRAARVVSRQQKNYLSAAGLHQEGKRDLLRNWPSFLHPARSAAAVIPKKTSKCAKPDREGESQVQTVAAVAAVSAPEQEDAVAAIPLVPPLSRQVRAKGTLLGSLPATSKGVAPLQKAEECEGRPHQEVGS